MASCDKKLFFQLLEYMFSFQAQITEEAKENNVPPPDLAEMSKIGAERID